ncbi:hypothetical protein BDFB_011653 [Asbolus verrucosus]|uniref:Uncharacterized protein n=1 Tax=Asbolus verrucosus TaxID=1661398 RepID=A0A482VLX8_ASBVE|nr:hypothetical protein BDFB_011653 [Asbolus verrucosus]
MADKIVNISTPNFCILDQSDAVQCHREKRSDNLNPSTDAIVSLQDQINKLTKTEIEVTADHAKICQEFAIFTNALKKKQETINSLALLAKLANSHHRRETQQLIDS